MLSQECQKQELQTKKSNLAYVLENKENESDSTLEGLQFTPEQISRVSKARHQKDTHIKMVPKRRVGKEGQSHEVEFEIVEMLESTDVSQNKTAKSTKETNSRVKR